MPGGQSKKGDSPSHHHPIRPLHLQSQSSRSNALRRQHGRPAEYWWRERKQLQRFCKLPSTIHRPGKRRLAHFCPGAKALQVFQPSYNYPFFHGHHANQMKRMLEDPSYSQVVRWGDDGGSFVVLEVRASQHSHSPPQLIPCAE